MAHPHNIVLHSRLVEGQGGLPCIRVANELADAEIYLNGGHVAHYRPRGAGQPVLWTSAASEWAAGRPIRGGIPLCWPWFAGFGPEGGPAHGVARTAPWTWVSSSALAGGATRVELALEDGLDTRRWWPRPFALRLAVTVGRSLDVGLTVRNRSDEAVSWTGALHTYLAVSDARRVQVDGFDGCRYRDRMDADAVKTQAGPIRFAGETDRIYFGGAPTARVVDPGFRRRIALTGRGSGSTVVWNPWVDKSARMPDFGDDEWPRMCCVETARAPGDECELAPGAAHELGVTIAVE